MQSYIKNYYGYDIFSGLFKQNIFICFRQSAFLCGYTADEVKELGYLFYKKVVPTHDFQMLVKINEAGFSFFENIPAEEKLDYSIHYDFHLCKNSENKMLARHSLTPVFINKNKKISIALCSIVLSNNDSSGNVEIINNKTNFIYEYNFSTDKWDKKNYTLLKPREKEILLFSIQGFSSAEVAKKIFMSVDAVKFHKKNILKKLNVSTMAEAISFAYTHKIL